MDDMYLFPKDLNNLEEHESELITYQCRDCGCIFQTHKNLSTEVCIFCNSKNINYVDGEKDNKPFVFAFKKEIDEAIKDYKSKIMFHPLVPLVFKKKKTTLNMRKAYIPAYLATVNFKGKIDFLAADKNMVVQDKKKMVETKKYDVSSDVNFDYVNVLINGYSKINERTFYSMADYNCGEVLDFKEDMLKDAYYIQADISSEDGATKVKNKVKNNSLRVVKNNINHQLKKLDQNNTITNFDFFKEVLLPVYFINVKYHKKDYLYIMNAESGRSVIHVPCGIIEVIIFSLLLFGILFLLAYLFAYFV